MSNPLPGSRVAALYDIHGNLPALDATLAEVDERGIEQVVVGGDVVLGPMPVETLARLRALGPRARFIRGNCDRLVADASRGQLSAALPTGVQAAIRWTADQLGPTDCDFLRELPDSSTIDVGGLGEVLFCHATLRSDEEIFTLSSPAERVAPMFAATRAQLVVCGHTHMQFDRIIGATRVINAGSVGMPYGAPGAYWLELGPDVAMRRTAYDLRDAAERVRRTRYPDAAEFAQRSVLEPISESAMQELFERAIAARER
jgi:predicted phosphodiesterase